MPATLWYAELRTPKHGPPQAGVVQITSHRPSRTPGRLSARLGGAKFPRTIETRHCAATATAAQSLLTKRIADAIRNRQSEIHALNRALCDHLSRLTIDWTSREPAEPTQQQVTG
jgi:hypothetical protein